MQNEEADLGVFVVTSPPSRGMEAEASRTGTYNHPSYEFSVPKLQIYQIQDYFRNILPTITDPEPPISKFDPEAPAPFRQGIVSEASP